MKSDRRPFERTSKGVHPLRRIQPGHQQQDGQEGEGAQRGDARQPRKRPQVHEHPIDQRRLRRRDQQADWQPARSERRKSEGHGQRQQRGGPGGLGVLIAALRAPVPS